jgi:ADP-heptose:LPS heptosyltransferase
MAVDAAPENASARILILRRDNIGDLVCTTPLVAALRARLPRARLSALVNSYNAEVLAGNASLDEVFVYEKLKHRSGGLLSHLRTRLAQMSRLRGQPFDCVLVPAPSPQTLKLARSLKARELIAAPATVPAGMHEVERSFAVGRALGISGRPGPLSVHADPGKVAELARAVGAGPFVAVHISARRPAQRWPLERYEQLISELARRGRVMLLWAPGARDDARHPGDDEAAQALQRRLRDAAVAVPTPDLKTLVGALSLAEKVICPDGGAMHLAAGLGKPVVALFGDSTPARWRPWGVAHRVVQPESRNLADLPLEPVLEACEGLG